MTPGARHFWSCTCDTCAFTFSPSLDRLLAASVECRKAYHAAHTIKCLHCSEPVAPEKGKFSGEFFEVEGGGRVHGECFEEYSEATADKCLVCKGAVRKKEGFSGDFMIVDNGKVHKVRRTLALLFFFCAQVAVDGYSTRCRSENVSVIDPSPQPHLRIYLAVLLVSAAFNEIRNTELAWHIGTGRGAGLRLAKQVRRLI